MQPTPFFNIYFIDSDEKFFFLQTQKMNHLWNLKVKRGNIWFLNLAQGKGPKNKTIILDNLIVIYCNSVSYLTEAFTLNTKYVVFT
jgi:hypothetical protein